ncbi:unnamed protein product [Effrenium voratum]|nr:unnamed protein product [Effrenium voratum]
MGYAPNAQSVRSAGWEEDIGRREEMEDGWIFIDCYSGSPRSCYFAIYDGHGGRQCVEYVVEHLHENLLLELEKEPANVPDSMMRAFELTDDSMQSSGINSSGCTACCCLLRQEKAFMERVLYTGHVGDARAVLCRKGLAVRLTGVSDHKATDVEEARRVVEAGGTIYHERVNGMLAISRAFGDFQLKAPTWPNDIVSNVPEVSATLLCEGDIFVIMACDGLWDVIEDQDAVNLVIEGMRTMVNTPCLGKWWPAC